jgi:hypothetical protein
LCVLAHRTLTTANREDIAEAPARSVVTGEDVRSAPVCGGVEGEVTHATGRRAQRAKMK